MKVGTLELKKNRAFLRSYIHVHTHAYTSVYIQYPLMKTVLFVGIILKNDSQWDNVSEPN